MTWNAHWPLSPANTHKQCSHTSSHLRRHCDGIPLPHLSLRGIVGVMYVPSGDAFFSLNPAKMILTNVCKRYEIHLALFNTKGLESAVPLFSWLTIVQSVTPLQPFTSAAFRGGLWMAMPWIYTWDLTIIHPRSFQIDSLLKVNCTS